MDDDAETDVNLSSVTEAAERGLERYGCSRALQPRLPSLERAMQRPLCSGDREWTFCRRRASMRWKR